MDKPEWDGSRPQVCPIEACAASEYYWSSVGREIPLHRLPSSPLDRGIPYIAWGADKEASGWWYFCPECDKIMTTPGYKLFRELRTCRDLD